MLKRILAIIGSAIIMALGTALFSYVPHEQRDPDVYYFSLTGYFIFALYIYLVFYVGIGLVTSWLIDKCRKPYKKKTITTQYFIGIMLYSLAGLSLGTIYYFISAFTKFHLNNFIETLGFWFTASFVYFHILWVLEKEFFKKRRF